MKKIHKNHVEKIVRKKIIPNKIVMGIDVAEHATGVAILRTTNDYVIIDKVYKIVVPKNVFILDAVDLFWDQLDKIKEEINKKYKIDINVIEDCFFGQNIKTLKFLARFGILAYVKFKKLVRQSKLIMPKSARCKINFKKSHKSIKGKALKKEIIQYINEIFQIQITDNDKADALVLALGGIVDERR